MNSSFSWQAENHDVTNGPSPYPHFLQPDQGFTGRSGSIILLGLPQDVALQSRSNRILRAQRLGGRPDRYNLFNRLRAANAHLLTSLRRVYWHWSCYCEASGRIWCEHNFWRCQCRRSSRIGHISHLRGMRCDEIRRHLPAIHESI